MIYCTQMFSSPEFLLLKVPFSPRAPPWSSDPDSECSQTPSRGALAGPSRSCCDSSWTADCRRHWRLRPTPTCRPSPSWRCWGSGWASGWTGGRRGGRGRAGRGGWGSGRGRADLARAGRPRSWDCCSKGGRTEGRRGILTETPWRSLQQPSLQLCCVESCWWRRHWGRCCCCTLRHWSASLGSPRQILWGCPSCNLLSWTRPLVWRPLVWILRSCPALDLRGRSWGFWWLWASCAGGLWGRSLPGPGFVSGLRTSAAPGVVAVLPGSSAAGWTRCWPGRWWGPAAPESRYCWRWWGVWGCSLSGASCPSHSGEDTVQTMFLSSPERNHLKTETCWSEQPVWPCVSRRTGSASVASLLAGRGRHPPRVPAVSLSRLELTQTTHNVLTAPALIKLAHHLIEMIRIWLITQLIAF